MIDIKPGKCISAWQAEGVPSLVFVEKLVDLLKFNVLYCMKKVWKSYLVKCRKEPRIEC